MGTFTLPDLASDEGALAHLLLAETITPKYTE